MTTDMIKNSLAEYFKAQPVLKAWLFGSFSREEQTPDSDVDILVQLDKSRPIGLKFFSMWSDLEDLLGRKVDLVSEGTLLPFAQESADKDKILIYERAERGSEGCGLSEDRDRRGKWHGQSERCARRFE